MTNTNNLNCILCGQYSADLCSGCADNANRKHDQKIANETLDKVVAEIDKKLKTCIAYDINPNPEVMEMFDDMYAFMQEQLNDLKSAILAMKKETKSG